jgi:hypothetical protein
VTNGFRASPEELRAHASKLEELGDRLRTALDAANQVTLGTEAYGVLCSFFVPVVHDVSHPGVEALSAASASLAGTAGNVKDTASTYGTVDDESAAMFSDWEM